MAWVIGLGLWGDWVFDWPRWVRLSMGCVYAGVGLWAGHRHLYLPWRKVPAGDRLALAMERRDPGLRSRLVSAVQLGRSRGDGEGREGPANPAGPEGAQSEAFVRRLILEAEGLATGLDLGRLVPPDGVWRAIRRVVPFVAVLLLALGLGGETARILVRRALGENVALPRETQLVEVTGGAELARGDDFLVSARVQGVMPKEGQLFVRQASGRIQRMAMEPAESGRGEYRRLLANLTSDFQYWVRIHDSESAVFDVQVLPRPVVTNLSLTLEYPRYTGLPAREVVPGELTLLRGGRLRLEGWVSQPITSAVVRLEGVETQKVAKVSAGGGGRFQADMEVEDPRWTGFSVSLVDTKGIASRDPAVYAVNVVEDQPPVVRVVLPARREELVTPRGTVLIAFEASDDYGLARLRVLHQPAATTNTVVDPTAIELELGEAPSSEVRRRFEWRIADIRPLVEEGAFLEFWVEAMDRREAGGPGVGRSERYLARVVSEAEKRWDLLTRAGDAIGRLGDVAQGQERLNDSLGRIILEKVPPR
ncbi:MAG: DUF4175 family protein [Limisphaerales bacterium]